MQDGIFDISQPGTFNAHYLAEVVDVNDPESLGRVQIRLHGFPGENNSDEAIWARVAVPFAGSDRGVFYLPDVGDEVLVTFVNGDSRVPIVVGSLWNGSQQPPDSLSGNGVDRYVIKSKKGSVIGIYEEGSPRIVIRTRGGIKVELDNGGRKAEITDGSSSVTIEPDGISISSAAQVTIDAPAGLTITAPTVTVSAAVADFSGIVTANVVQATTVVSSIYTPGAGNIW